MVHPCLMLFLPSVCEVCMRLQVLVKGRTDCNWRSNRLPRSRRQGRKRSCEQLKAHVSTRSNAHTHTHTHLLPTFSPKSQTFYIQPLPVLINQLDWSLTSGAALINPQHPKLAFLPPNPFTCLTLPSTSHLQHFAARGCLRSIYCETAQRWSPHAKEV